MWKKTKEQNILIEALRKNVDRLETKLKYCEWACPECGSVLDRDLNASINIKNFALNKLCTEHTLKNHGTLPSLEGALTHEAHPIAFCVGG